MSGDLMPTGKEIAARLSDARFDTDLGLIYGIWPKENCKHDVMRSSEHLAIRKAASALDRIGSALARHLTQDRVAIYRTLPEIKPTTRVRKTPQRFWLEFDCDERSGDGAAGQVMFIEFSKTEVRIGLRFPILAAAFEQSGAGLPDHPICMNAMDTGIWEFEQRRPPAEPAACSNDLNAWLSGRFAAKQQKAVFQTISKACPSIRPSMKDLLAGLSEASMLCDNVKGRQANRTSQATTGHESQRTAMH